MAFGAILTVGKVVVPGSRIGARRSAIALALALSVAPDLAAAQVSTRKCSQFGAGFFEMPGTSTCIQIGGLARFEYQFSGPFVSRNSSPSGYSGRGRIQLDAYTPSEWGAIRTFVRFDMSSDTGYALRSGSADRQARAFNATGIDTYGVAQKSVDIDKAFVQLGGFTAGHFGSFYDFYQGDIEFIADTSAPSAWTTNGIAYTAKLGAGVSATLSLEDPTFRRSPLYTLPSLAGQGIPYTGTTAVAPVAGSFNAAGLPTSAALLDVAQRNDVPDIVGVLRTDQSWGSAQLSAALHQIRPGSYVSAPANSAARLPEAVYGYGLLAGLRLNLDQIAPGDRLWLQAAFARGGMMYTGINQFPGTDTPTSEASGRFTFNTVDGYVDAYGSTRLAESWSLVAAYLHYWTPTVRQGLFASYGASNFGQARGPAGPLSSGLGGASLIPANLQFTPQQAVNYMFSPILKDFGMPYVGTNMVWSPVPGLDLGAEVTYAQVSMAGRVFDEARPQVALIGGVALQKTVTADGLWQARLRIDRQF